MKTFGRDAARARGGTSPGNISVTEVTMKIMPRGTLRTINLINNGNWYDAKGHLYT
jgi:hypothetical protein